MNSSHYNVVIIGAGTAGIMVAAQLKRKKTNLSIALIDPSNKHYYQPAWTLVAAGVFDYQKTIRNQADYIPKGVTWVQDRVTALNPKQNEVETGQSGSISYDYLVVAPGLVNHIEALPGLEHALQTEQVSSVYIDPEKTRRQLQAFRGGNALFTQPNTPIKCGGAPQKIMYLSEDLFRKKGIRSQSNVIFATPGSVIFGVDEFAKPLNEIIRSRDIIFKPSYTPVRINVSSQTVTFAYSGDNSIQSILNTPVNIGEKAAEVQGVAEVDVPYDLLHLAPPQKAPDFVSNSILSYQSGKAQGWMEVDINTLQHPVYKNVFSLGDVASLPTAKTGAAIRKQAPVVVANIVSLLDRGALSDATYEGYSSCPLLTGYGKMLLAEFKYGNTRDSDPLLSKIFDTTKPSYPMWLLKKYGLPFMYWNLMLRGKM